MRTNKEKNVVMYQHKPLISVVCKWHVHTSVSSALNPGIDPIKQDWYHHHRLSSYLTNTGITRSNEVISHDIYVDIKRNI